MKKWKCLCCNTEFERLQITWGECCGQKVDILDYCCPCCGNTGYKEEPQLIFFGTEEEKNAYWDREWDGW